MKRILLLGIILGISFLAISCDGPSEESLLTKGESRTLVGTLKNDNSTPQGMITGWVVHDESNNGDPVPVDITGLIETAQRFNNNRVSVKGTMMDRMDASGTQNTVFVAESISSAN